MCEHEYLDDLLESGLSQIDQAALKTLHNGRKLKEAAANRLCKHGVLAARKALKEAQNKGIMLNPIYVSKAYNLGIPFASEVLPSPSRAIFAKRVSIALV